MFADENQGFSDYLLNGPRSEQSTEVEALRPSGLTDTDRDWLRSEAPSLHVEPTEYRIVEETKGEVTYTESYSSLRDAANSLLVNCGGEQGMPGDTVEEVEDAVRVSGGVTVHPFPGCVWRLLVLGEAV